MGRVWLGVGIVAFLLGAVAARGEDSDRLRWYAGLRYDALSLTNAHDAIGGVIGFNYNRYLGAEFAIDSYERKVGSLSEMSVLGLMPQVRLRYPLLDDRLTPYLVGGVGLAVSQANDAKTSVHWDNGKTEVHAAGSAGAGLEYFVADNVAIGFEGKYLFSGVIDYESGGRSGATSLGAPLLTVGVRLFYPQLDPAAGQASASAAVARLYMDLRIGGALPATTMPFSGIGIQPEQSLFGSNFASQFGFTLGSTIGRYAAVEVSMDNYEYQLHYGSDGAIGEYSLFPVLVQGRLRYPLFNDRLEPYLLGGVGAEVGQVSDLNGTGKSLGLKGNDLTPVGALGAGVDYWVISNVAVGALTKYVISRGHEVRFRGQPTLQGNFDTFVLSLSLRIVFVDL